MESFRRAGNVTWLVPAVRLARTKVPTNATALVTWVFVTIALAGFLSPARAGEIFRDDFSSPDGSLIGTTADVGGTWSQTGSNSTNPIQINAGRAVITTIGQDLYSPLSISCRDPLRHRHENEPRPQRHRRPSQRRLFSPPHESSSRPRCSFISACLPGRRRTAISSASSTQAGPARPRLGELKSWLTAPHTTSISSGTSRRGARRTTRLRSRSTMPRISRTPGPAAMANRPRFPPST